MKCIPVFLGLIFGAMFSLAQPNLNNTYVGAEKICWQKTKTDSCDNSDNFKPDWKWYRLSLMRIRGDSVYLNQSPISIYGKDTSYSASDGGFYYYHGTLKILSDTTVFINLIEIPCNYCGELKEKQRDGSYKRVYRTKTYFCKLNESGFWTNNIFFKKQN